MAIELYEEVGYIDTPKDDEFVYVNINTTGKAIFLDTRVWVENDNYEGYTKRGLTFRSVEQAEEFIALMQQGLDMFKVALAKEEEPKTEKKKPRGPKAAAEAAKKEAAKKTTAKKTTTKAAAKKETTPKKTAAKKATPAAKGDPKGPVKAARKRAPNAKTRG